MNAPIEYTVIDHDGKPAKAVVDYAQFIELLKLVDSEATVPHDVVKAVYGEEDLSPVKAWRLYRDMSQAEVAKSMGISQPAYAQMEKPGLNLRKSSREKLVRALNISMEQLDV